MVTGLSMGMRGQTLHIKVCHVSTSPWYFWRTENGQTLKFPCRTRATVFIIYWAVDYFGQWHTKEGRKEVKKYGALLTSLASRAIHIEVAHSMETDSFLQALRHFICRRGPIRELCRDQGSDFVGAEVALQEMDDEKIKAEQLKENID